MDENLDGKRHRLCPWVCYVEAGHGHAQWWCSLVSQQEGKGEEREANFLRKFYSAITNLENLL